MVPSLLHPKTMVAADRQVLATWSAVCPASVLPLFEAARPHDHPSQEARTGL